MTNQELATKLKEAGFPNKHSDATTWSTNLSELIEACMPDFDRLVTDKAEIGKWHAIAYRNHDLIQVIGLSPEEAVANLWLKLKEYVNNEE